MENLITKQAQYGLDFELIYSIDHNRKENVGKKASVPSPQSFGPSCERTIKLDRIGNFFINAQSANDNFYQTWLVV